MSGEPLSNEDVELDDVERQSDPGPRLKAPVKRRRNKRSESTIQTILKATEEVVLISGVDRISILDVCKVAGISRGTFYRYFSSQDELLDAFSRYKRDHFHKSLHGALSPFADPEERFDALIRYLDNYLEVGHSRQLLAVAPKYALSWYRLIFHDSILRFQEELSIVFDDWDNKLAVELDRELISEMVIRYILSEQLVPASSESRRALPKKIKRLIRDILASHA